MKAAVFTNGNTIEVKQIPTPEPKADEVLIKVAAAGICGSDLHCWRSGKLWFPDAAPVVYGHELAGEISATGDAVKNFCVGDRVVVQPMITCGKCYACSKGTFQLCPQVQHIGIWFNGGFAEYAVIPEANAFRIPDKLSFDVASLTDVYGCAVHCANRITPDSAQTIAVIGTGPIALSTAQILRLENHISLIMVGRRDSVLQKAKQIGAADEIINIKKQNPVEVIKKLTNGKGADIVVEAVGGIAETLDTAFEMVASDGCVVIMGEFFGKGLVPLQTGMEKQISLLWSTGYGNFQGVSEFRATIELLASGRVNACDLITHRFALGQITQAFETAENKACSEAVKVIINP